MNEWLPVWKHLGLIIASPSNLRREVGGIKESKQEMRDSVQTWALIFAPRSAGMSGSSDHHTEPRGGGEGGLPAVSLMGHTRSLWTETAGQWFYLEVERLFHPGPWKQTLRHHRNRSSQYVDRAEEDHPKRKARKKKTHHHRSLPGSLKRHDTFTSRSQIWHRYLSPLDRSSPWGSVWSRTLHAHLRFAGAAAFQRSNRPQAGKKGTDSRRMRTSSCD